MQKKSPLTAEEVSALRGIAGTMAWKGTQTGPQYVADISLLLSEVPYATVETLAKANKLAREMKRDSKQCIKFPAWNVDWRKLTVVTWADASQSNRPDKSSTLGTITGIAPSQIVEGDEVEVALVSWKTAKTPRQCLGSNGAEVQAITEGEDITYKVRTMLMEFHGIDFDRRNLYQKVREFTSGALVMDSRGVYDAATRNLSMLHGLRSSRAGYELTLAVNQARQINTIFRWVNGLAQLADSLTKANDRKVLLQMLSNQQKWRIVFDPKFVAGKKKKKELLEELRKQHDGFINCMRRLAESNRWPWDDSEDKNGVDVMNELVGDFNPNECF